MSTKDLEWHDGTHGWGEHDGYPRHQHSLNGNLTIVRDDPHLHFKGSKFTSPASKASEPKHDHGPAYAVGKVSNCPACIAYRAGTADSPQPVVRVSDIAGLLHADACYTAPKCNRYKSGRGDHYHFYQVQAAELVDRLEPIIGAANVEPVLLAVLEVLS